MARISRHLLAASALLGAATLAVPALAQRGGMMERPHMNGSGMMGGRMGRGDMAQMCGRMTQGMPGGEQGGHPNQQWRRRAPAPGRG
ncbi:hypothetical protein [Roseicella aerolata]|uniref:Uncharacterized protein n=1 Tax=Roseicella aerolata TaxID=2883479 RepID=A0A9X1LAI2_9PROT|nr:hypothetical protein [Roseicella aerolata]MCB4824859.1 hypothetical protein [Roseicella aerolata]